MQRRADLLIVIVVALAANFLYLAYSNGDWFFPDSVTYIEPARNMLDGAGFVRAGGVVETFRTPGYPLFLMPFIALTPAFALVVVVVQHLLAAAIAAAVYLFARARLSRAVALMAGIVFAIDPPVIHHANKVLSETLFTAILLVVFVLALRPRRSNVLIGILCGVLVLVRPVAIAYFAVLALWAALRSTPRESVAPLRTSARGLVSLVLASLLLPGAWAVRNYLETGVFTISAVAGVNTLLHRAAPALAIFDDYEFKDALRDRQDELQGDADDEIERTLHIDDAESLNPAVIGQWYGRIGRRIALQHPVGLAMTIVRGLLINLFGSDWEAVMMVSRIPSDVVQLALDAWSHIVTILAMVGVVAMWRRDRELALLIALTVAYYLVLSAGSEAEARFRVPVMPMIAIAAAYAVAGLRLQSHPSDA